MTNEARFLKQFRKWEHVSQRDLATELGHSSPQMISNIERGLCGFPTTGIRIFSRVYGRIAASQLIEAKIADYKKQLQKMVNRHCFGGK